MAISCDVTLASGIPLTAAYIRVDALAGYKGGFDCSANIYVSREDFIGGKPYAEQIIFNFEPDISADAPHVFAQAYAALKSQERFAGAVDVLEDEAA